MPFAFRDFRKEKSQILWWLTLSVGSLILAGLLSLFLVIARIPVFTPLITDPLFFKRCLVVHVNLALSVWIYSFIAVLFFLFLPDRNGSGFRKIASFFVSLSGVILMVFSAGVPNAVPVLSNYIPVIEHSFYLVGISLFFLGIFFTFMDKRIIPLKNTLDENLLSQLGIRVSVVFFIVAMEITAVSILNTNRDLKSENYFENLVWGGGHILQFSSEAAKIAVWFFILSPFLKESLNSKKWIRHVLLFFMTPAVIALPFVLSKSTTAGDYRNFFTTIMRFGIFPFVVIILSSIVYFLFRQKKIDGLQFSFFDLRLNGFFASAFLTILGFLLGSMISGANTMVPAHYHASIGAVTVSFMTVTFVILAYLGESKICNLKLVSVQPFIFGVGQAIFALGFAVAGLSGMGRKLYGNEQKVRTLSDTIGMSLMGVGGMIAILGGLIFLFYSGRAIVQIFKVQRERGLEVSRLKFQE